MEWSEHYSVIVITSYLPPHLPIYDSHTFSTTEQNSATCLCGKKGNFLPTLSIARGIHTQKAGVQP